MESITKIYECIDIIKDRFGYSAVHVNSRNMESHILTMKITINKTFFSRKYLLFHLLQQYFVSQINIIPGQTQYEYYIVVPALSEVYDHELYLDKMVLLPLETILNLLQFVEKDFEFDIDSIQFEYDDIAGSWRIEYWISNISTSQQQWFKSQLDKQLNYIHYTGPHVEDNNILVIYVTDLLYQED